MRALVNTAPDRLQLPARLPTGHQLTVTRTLQADEADGRAQGPGVFISVRSSDGAILPDCYLSAQEGMPTEADYAGLRLHLAGFSGPMLGLFDVHRDPGVWLVIIGAILITLGTVVAFAFYLREGN